jgi:hypothetical protein
MQGISRLAEKLLASQEGLSCTELVSKYGFKTGRKRMTEQKGENGYCPTSTDKVSNTFG